MTAKVILVNGDGSTTSYDAVIVVDPGDVNVDLSGVAKTDQTMGCVLHGSDPNVTRPAGYVCVTWVGSVVPNNMLDTDIYENTNPAS